MRTGGKKFALGQQQSLSIFHQNILEPILVCKNSKHLDRRTQVFFSSDFGKQRVVILTLKMSTPKQSILKIITLRR